MWPLFIATCLSLLVLGSYCQALQVEEYPSSALEPQYKRYIPLQLMADQRGEEDSPEKKSTQYEYPILHSLLKGKRGQFLSHRLPILHQLLGKRDDGSLGDERVDADADVTSLRMSKRGGRMFLYSYPLLHMLPGRKRYPSYPGHHYPILHGVPGRGHLKRAMDTFPYRIR